MEMSLYFTAYIMQLLPDAVHECDSFGGDSTAFILQSDEHIAIWSMISVSVSPKVSALATLMETFINWSCISSPK